MSELDHDPLLQEILKLRADLDELRGQENSTPKTGTWTPTFVGSGTAGVYTYVNQVGQYYLVGKLVFIIGRVTISAIGTPPAGNMTINGLPFTSSARNGAITFGRISQFNYTAGALQLTGRIGVSGTTIALEESFDNVVTVAVPAANFTNTACDLIFNGFYDLP